MSRKNSIAPFTVNNEQLARKNTEQCNSNKDQEPDAGIQFKYSFNVHKCIVYK